MKGLLCHIYKHKGWSGDGLTGFSSKVDSVILIGREIPQIFEPSDSTPEVVLHRRGDYLFATPLDYGEKWYMAGGTFVYTSDSRFPTDYPIPLHDRTE